MNAGLWEDGRAVLMQMVRTAPDRQRIRPMVYYYLAYFTDQLGHPDEAEAYRRLAQRMSPDYEFPFQAEAITVLERAMRIDPDDARAPYYLGNLLYDWQPDRATEMWELSARLDPSFPITHRNLALAYAHKKGDDALERAIGALEKAVSLSETYAIHFAELDALYESAGRDPARRLARMEQHRATVLLRDDATARFVTLKVQQGQYDDAIDLMTGRAFEVWEGGRLNVAGDWVNAHLLRGCRHMTARRSRAALADFETAHAALGDLGKARDDWERATSTETSGPSRRRRGTRVSPGHYYRALALQKLGQTDEARTQFESLIEEDKRQLESPMKAAGSLSVSEQLSLRTRRADAYCLIGLGHMGLGQKDRADEALHNALEARPDHLLAIMVRENPL